MHLLPPAIAGGDKPATPRGFNRNILWLKLCVFVWLSLPLRAVLLKINLIRIPMGNFNCVCRFTFIRWNPCVRDWSGNPTATRNEWQGPGTWSPTCHLAGHAQKNHSKNISQSLAAISLIAFNRMILKAHSKTWGYYWIKFFAWRGV